jgi:hypothetical protein
MCGGLASVLMNDFILSHRDLAAIGLCVAPHEHSYSMGVSSASDVFILRCVSRGAYVEI